MNELDVGDAVEVWFNPWEDDGPKQGKIIQRLSITEPASTTSVWHYRIQFDGQTEAESKGGRWWPVGRVKLSAQAPEVRDLIADAAEALEHFTEDELEEHATRILEANPVVASKGVDSIDWFGEGDPALDQSHAIRWRCRGRGYIGAEAERRPCPGCLQCPETSAPESEDE